jgi:hypothetical protein
VHVTCGRQRPFLQTSLNLAYYCSSTTARRNHDLVYLFYSTPSQILLVFSSYTKP